MKKSKPKYPRIRSVADLARVIDSWLQARLSEIDNSELLREVNHKLDKVVFTSRRINRRRRHTQTQLKNITRTSIVVAVRKTDQRTNRLEEALHERIDPAINLATCMAQAWESVWQLLGCSVIRNGLRDDRSRQVFLAVNIADMDTNQIGELVMALHEAGEPFRLLNVGEQSDSGIADHIRWFMAETARNQNTLRNARPDATLDQGTWIRWYLDMAKKIAANHTRWKPILVFPYQSVHKLPSDIIADRILGKGELMVLLHQLLTYQSKETAVTALALQGGTHRTLEYDLLPTRIDVSDEAIRTQTSGENGDKEAWYRILKIGPVPSEEFDGDPRLRTMLLPLVASRRNIVITEDWYPVPRPQRSGFLKLIRKKIRRLEQLLAKEDAPRAYSNMLSQLRQTIEAIRLADAHAFGRQTTLVLKAESEAALIALYKDVIEVFRLAQIRYETVKGQLQLAQAIRRLLPIGPEPFDLDEVLPDPELSLSYALLQTRIPVPTRGVLAGAFKRSMTPLVLGGLIKMILVTGGLGSGKSTILKNVVWGFQYIDPKRRTIVVDNSGYSSTRGRVANRPDREAGLRGWVDICRIFGGTTVFAEDSKNPSELYNKLVKLRDVRLVLYYPDPKRPDKDQYFLEWVAEELKANTVRGSTEEDVQQMLVFDDILGWVSMPNDPRSRYLFLSVIPLIKSTGTLTMMSVQTSGVLKEADAAAFEMLKSVMEMSINFPTTAHADVADNLGIRNSTLTPEGAGLSQSVSAQMREMLLTRMFQGNRDREAMVVFGNLVDEIAVISIHPKILEVISRMEINPNGNKKGGGP